MRISDWSSDVCSSDLTDHLRLDAEVLELEFDLPRQGFQRVLVVALGLRLGIVEQGQRRDAGAVADVEQRDLLLALCPVALFHLRRRRRSNFTLPPPARRSVLPFPVSVASPPSGPPPFPLPA